MFAYVLIQANIREVFSEFSFLMDFMLEDWHLGEEGYSLVTMEASLHLIKSLDWAQLLL